MPGGLLTHLNLPPDPPERTVVLGGRGFLGSTLVTYLADAGCQVVVLGRQEVDLCAPGATAALVDLLRPGDAVVMSAAVTRSRDRSNRAFLANIQMAVNLCDALTEIPPSHLVYISSDFVYPHAISSIDEGCCPSGTDLYGVMHRAREEILATSLDVPLAILRFTSIYGGSEPRPSYGPARFVLDATNKGQIEVFGDGEDARDFITASDFAAVVHAVLERRSAGLVNVASGRSLPFRELAQAVASLFDPAPPIVSIPRTTSPTVRRFDITELTASLPELRFTSLESGLQDLKRTVSGPST